MYRWPLFTGYFYCTGGHINPAISFALALFRKFSWKRMILYWIAQYLGALLASATVLGIYHGTSPASKWQSATRLCYPLALCFLCRGNFKRENRWRVPHSQESLWSRHCSDLCQLPRILVSRIISVNRVSRRGKLRNDQIDSFYFGLQLFFFNYAIRTDAGDDAVCLDSLCCYRQIAR